jgi:hypothetical protein
LSKKQTQTNVGLANVDADSVVQAMVATDNDPITEVCLFKFPTNALIRCHVDFGFDHVPRTRRSKTYEAP